MVEDHFRLICRDSHNFMRAATKFVDYRFCLLVGNGASLLATVWPRAIRDTASTVVNDHFTAGDFYHLGNHIQYSCSNSLTFILTVAIVITLITLFKST